MAVPDILCRTAQFGVLTMEEILRELAKGSFDKNPRLCRRVICSKCGTPGKKFVDFLRDGQFEVGKMQRITVTEPGQYALYKYEEENATPILLKIVCDKCGQNEVISDPVLTVEYMTTICRSKKPRITYV